MSDSTTTHARMTRVALRSSASSLARVPKARVAPCVLDLLDHARPRAHAAMESLIWSRSARGGRARYGTGAMEPREIITLGVVTVRADGRLQVIEGALPEFFFHERG
jgi:hypothetical protein